MFGKYYLDNGIPVVLESQDHVKSVTLGVWVNAGSRDESDEVSGISHFLEHMHFKGTPNRSAVEIANAADAVGGELNAFTTREGTTFYARVLDHQTDIAVDLISDILMNSTFPVEEIEREKKIIIEEIRMVEDTPDDLIHDLFYRTAFGDAGLGRSVLGSTVTIQSMDRPGLLAYARERYIPEDMVVAAAGRFNHEIMLQSLNATLGRMETGGGRKSRGVQSWSPDGFTIVNRDLAEAHICIGVRGFPHKHPDRYALYLLNMILGGSVSSSLFQEVREKRGLAYSIYSFLSSYSDTGIFGAYAGTSPERVQEVLRLILDEFARARKSLNDEAFSRAKEQLKGNLILGLESTSARMNHIARNEICFGRNYTPDEIIARIDGVARDEVLRVAAELLDNDHLFLAVLGPVDEGDIDRSYIRIMEA